MFCTSGWKKTAAFLDRNEEELDLTDKVEGLNVLVRTAAVVLHMMTEREGKTV